MTSIKEIQHFASLKEFQHLQIPLQDLQSATNDFAETNCIGRGGFGKVYKGEILLSGELTVVAIKRLDGSFGQGTTEFWKEIMMLSQYKHINLVSLLGFCDEGGESLLVYEYLSNKSLDIYLKSHPDLSWHNRLHICYGAATGLKFLHEPVGGSQQRVLHRDIKSANILLDNNLQSKIADFGLSKLGPANQQFSFMFSNVVGTPGYCDPLYAHTGLLTKESDVYSFGVVLFEVLCGRLAYVHDYNDIHRSLTGLARKCYEEKKLDTIVCSNIRENISPLSLKIFSTIAYQCLNIDRAERPSMAEVLEEIHIAYRYQEIYQTSIPEVPLKEIEVGTENFKTSFGEHQYGQMYIGELSIFGKPTEVIVKRFVEHSRVTLTDFLSEIYYVCDKPHRNLTSIIGYCDEDREKMIVYEYPKRGRRLDEYMMSSNASNCTTLTWLQRLKICIGAAQGLYHLHSSGSHEDFRSANILVDDTWVPTIYNWMMTTPTLITNHVYKAPEYIINRIGTKEADVYSFGILLFEVLCGRLCTEEIDGCMLSAKLIKEFYGKKKLDEIVDPSLTEQVITSNSVKTYSTIAYQCLMDDPKERPSMDVVIKELEELLRMEIELNNQFNQEIGKLEERTKTITEQEKMVMEKQEKIVRAKAVLMKFELARQEKFREDMLERMKSLTKR